MDSGCMASPLMCFSAQESVASLGRSSGFACLTTLYAAAQSRLNLPLQPFEEALFSLEAVQLSKPEPSAEDVYTFIRKLNLKHAVRHVYRGCVSDSLEVLTRYLQEYSLPWMVLAPLLNRCKLILGIKGEEVLVFDPFLHDQAVQFDGDNYAGVATWRSLIEISAEWGDDVTPTQAMMMLPQPIPALDDDVREREETYTFLMMSQLPSSGAIASKKDRQALGLVGSWNFVYGEITFGAIAGMFQVLKQISDVTTKPDAKFVDLGSGTGKAVIAAALLHRFDVCEGVELLKSVHSLSLDILEEFTEQIRPNLPNDSVARTVRFVNADILQHDWSGADVVLLHWTTFTPDVVSDITKAATKLRPGSIVITVSQPLFSPDNATITQGQAPFRIVFQQFHDLSWGETVVFYQMRTETPTAFDKLDDLVACR